MDAVIMMRFETFGGLQKPPPKALTSAYLKDSS
jgi:hypothetical protein